MAELPQADPSPATPADSEVPEESGKADRDSRVTARPEFEPSELARQIESSHRTSTQPPEPSFATLRESCRTMRLADLDLESLEVGWEEDEAAAPDKRGTQKK